MKVSTKGRYALRSLSHLAVSYIKNENCPVSIKYICEKEDISNRYLENIFVKMRKAGLVNSVKGEKGGFYLAKSPEKVSIYDVFLAVENDISPSRCVVDMKFCDKIGICGIRQVWVKFDRHINSFLKKTYLSEIARLHLKGGGR